MVCNAVAIEYTEKWVGKSSYTKLNPLRIILFMVKIEIFLII